VYAPAADGVKGGRGARDGRPTGEPRATRRPNAQRRGGRGGGGRELPIRPAGDRAPRGARWPRDRAGVPFPRGHGDTAM